jgi:UDP-2,3-diacylglucosamine pyrophosphatase LpxH
LNQAKKSIIVVADTHFGLNRTDQQCDPNAFSDFLNWLKQLEEKGNLTLPWGVESNTKQEITLWSPEKIIFAGDIVELWDASQNAIDVSTRSIVQSASTLGCEKIYLLGNHDYDLLEIEGKYPLGQSNLNILNQYCIVEKGSKKYLFLHGHQFDKYFAFPSWKFMPHLRKAAMTFGEYTWVFVAIFFIDLLLGVATGFEGLSDKVLIAVLAAASLPFLIIKFGRDIWNKLKTTKYKPREAEKNLESWWNNFIKSNEYTKQDWVIIYGHTHIIDFWTKKQENNLLTVFNVPSWVIDRSEKGKISLESIFRHGFLYIDEENEEFFGWDTVQKKPFLIPKDVIVERRENGDITKLERYDITHRLREIGWPQELIDKWVQYRPDPESAKIFNR